MLNQWIFRLMEKFWFPCFLGTLKYGQSLSILKCRNFVFISFFFWIFLIKSFIEKNMKKNSYQKSSSFSEPPKNSVIQWTIPLYYSLIFSHDITWLSIIKYFPLTTQKIPIFSPFSFYNLQNQFIFNIFLLLKDSFSFSIWKLFHVKAQQEIFIIISLHFSSKFSHFSFSFNFLFSI